MLDDLLFRGIDADTGDWREGHIDTIKNNDGFISTYIRLPGTEAYGFGSLYCVQSATVGRCLGFRDILGKKIFQGDILRRDLMGETVIGEVVWTDMGFTGFMLKVEKGGVAHFYPMGRGQHDDDEGDLCNDEIIGNIHENPKLLSEEKLR